MHGAPQRENHFPALDEAEGSSAVPSPGTPPSAAPSLDEPELEAALQLLVERAQYITGATGTALALPRGDDMVCRASAGSCAPAVGARLQVRSGLTGESIARRQLLRCDNAETDPRVNLEACRALGIASIVVLPLLRPNGEVRGLFELFSDHPFAFEERDLVALERMADLTLTALDLAEQRHGAVPSPPRKADFTQPANTGTPVIGAPPSSAAAPRLAPQISAPSMPFPPKVSAHPNPETTMIAPPALAEPTLAESGLPPMPKADAPNADSGVLPESMLRVQKCASCGFPISEGRTFCLDCENKQDTNTEPPATPPATGALTEPEPTADENLPAFLANAAMAKESWFADHINLLAVIVLILGVVVAYVVFR